MTPFLSLENITCSYNDNIVLDDLSFVLGKGEIACLLGPSGCGKSTLLRAIAGFESIEKGAISLSGIPLSSPRFEIAPEKRKIGMVFQDYALFPHLTVKENILFGLRKRKSDATMAKVEELLQIVSLADFEDRYPHELSGGQQQRVALARALAPEPSLILLDEPFSNLDADLRARLAQEVREILKRLEISAILVTHDQNEAFSVADQIGLIADGKIAQWGTPYDLYHEPSSRFVAKFIGKGRFLKAKALTHESFETDFGIVEGNRSYRWDKGTPVDMLIRPDDVLCTPDSKTRATVLNKTFAGTATNYVLKLESGAKLEAAFPSHQDYIVGDEIGISLDTEHLIAFKS
jgi:iron(III) transport system ATP-binding protein